MVGQVVAPRDVLVLTPGICDCVPLPGQRDFAGVIMLRSRVTKVSLDFPGGPDGITSVLLRERQASESEKEV